VIVDVVSRGGQGHQHDDSRRGQQFANDGNDAVMLRDEPWFDSCRLDLSRLKICGNNR
jgi:hypothetical protein